MKQLTFIERHSAQGFTLIELVVAVGIIGILANMAVPSINAFKINAARSEARIQLKSIHALVESYRAAEGKSPDTFRLYNSQFASDPVLCVIDQRAVEIGLRLNTEQCKKLRYNYTFRPTFFDPGAGAFVKHVKNYTAIASAYKYRPDNFGQADVSLGRGLDIYGCPFSYSANPDPDLYLYLDMISLDQDSKMSVIYDAKTQCN